VNLEALRGLKRFQELQRETKPLVTNYIKRLRKGDASRAFEPVHMSYLLAVEPHKDWTPHYHVLVHEIAKLKPIRYRSLVGQWDHGHVKFNLVTSEESVRYVAKYLGKFATARVRASEHYGEK
jgi:hypothetical protein